MVRIGYDGFSFLDPPQTNPIEKFVKPVLVYSQLWIVFGNRRNEIVNGNDHPSWRPPKEHQGGQVLAGEVVNIRFWVANPDRGIVEKGLQVPTWPAPYE